MSKQSHTPGPWEFSAGADYGDEGNYADVTALNGNDSWGYHIPADEMMLGTNCKLDYCGDIAAICRDCRATHEIVVREKSSA
ncbi:hypothetical protein [Pseudomonas aeruginosa]|uniref:hypothetical protein n=1 Tax=Pseudomonas aeruginosa TaxID=287 RepID=UPI0029029126|nr:hypothetical protein [Pseudomonas aeruginosa]MDU0542827.1 hypothetical protein [Pseudomonas aeruginosa]